jgi:predicted nucleic acid-binding protein
MRSAVIVDTGPIIAFLNSRDRHHDWAVARFGELQVPLLSCEAALSEACFVLRRFEGGPAGVVELVHRGVVELPFVLEHEASVVTRLLTRYRDVPMSLADACLVRLSELHADSEVMTLDGDFAIYRRHGRQVIPLITV